MTKCPNCGKEIPHPEDGCVLATLMAVMRDWTAMPQSEVNAIWGKVDINALWDDLGPIIDGLEMGKYSE